MTKKQLIEREVAETLKHLDQVDRINCDPHFHTRLMARIDAGKKTNKLPLNRFLLKPVLIPALCIFIILINMTSVLWVFKGNDAETYDRETYLTAFAQEYSLNHYYTDVFTVNQ